MPIRESQLELLERQASYIDSLERYVAALWRRGSVDEEVEETLTRALRAYRRALSRCSVDELFEFGTRSAQARRK